MKVLVTGNEGFIGKHVYTALQDNDMTVIGLDIREQRPFGWSIRGDIRNADWVLHAIENLSPDAVIHLAARVGVRESVSDPSGYVETNVLGSLNMLEACRLAGVQQVVMASTSSVYGNVPHQVETALPMPLSPYAASKLGMEALAHSYHTLYGMNIAVLRLFSVYGEGIRPDLMIARLLDSIITGAPVTLFNDGNLFRDWTYVGDVVDGILVALNLKGCEVINIGRGSSVRLQTLVEILERISGGRVNAVPADAPPTEPIATRADIGKALRLLDYRPDFGIEEGLRRTWAWYQERVLA